MTHVKIINGLVCCILCEEPLETAFNHECKKPPVAHINQPKPPELYAIASDWKPTADNINALPEPLRRYIHDIETNCDPAGIIRENILVKDENAMLRSKLAEEKPLTNTK